MTSELAMAAWTIARSFALALVLVGTPAIAQWEIVDRVDSMTDEKRSMAITVLDTGQAFGLFRGSDKRIWASFILARDGAEQLGRRYPMMRVDKLPAMDLDRHRTGEAWQRAMYRASSNAATFVVFHGGGPADRGTLRDIMDGAEIRFRYFTVPDDAQKEVVFPLAGAKSAIAQALGIPADADSDRVARMQDWDRRKQEAEAVCDSQKGDARQHIRCRIDASQRFSKENPAP